VKPISSRVQRVRKKPVIGICLPGGIRSVQKSAEAKKQDSQKNYSLHEADVLCTSKEKETGK